MLDMDPSIHLVPIRHCDTKPCRQFQWSNHIRIAQTFLLVVPCAVLYQLENPNDWYRTKPPQLDQIVVETKFSVEDRQAALFKLFSDNLSKIAAKIK